MKYIIKELQRHLWRTVASISGYVISGLLIMLLLSVASGNEKNTFSILKGTGTHFIVYFPSETSCCSDDNKNGSVFADGVYTRMLNLQLIDSVKSIEGVRDAAPYLLFQMHNEFFNEQISLGGIDTGSIATKNNVCAKTNLIAGKFLSEDPNEIVAEESFVMGHNLSLGDTLAVFGGKMILAGIINSGIKPGKADFYSSIGNVRNILKDKLHCNSEGFDMNIILVEVSDSRIQDRVINQLKTDMSYLSISSYNCYQPASQVMNIMTKTSAIISIVIFVFLLVFSVRTQLTSLVERYHEIGILKSLGWSNVRISNQILITSVIQSVAGAITAILLGILIIALFNTFQARIFDLLEFRIRYESFFLILIMSVTGGIIAGIFPMIKIYRTSAGDMINNYL